MAQKWGCHLIQKVGFRINRINYTDPHWFQNGCNEDGKRDFYFLYTVKYMYFKFLWEQGSLDRAWKNDIAMKKLIKGNAWIWMISYKNFVFCPYLLFESVARFIDLNRLNFFKMITEAMKLLYRAHTPVMFDSLFFFFNVPFPANALCFICLAICCIQSVWRYLVCRWLLLLVSF